MGCQIASKNYSFSLSSGDRAMTHSQYMEKITTPEEALEAVKHDAWALQYVPDELKAQVEAELESK